MTTTKTKKKVKKSAKAPSSQKIAIASIIRPKNWNREKLGDIRGLVSSMNVSGQIVPIVVRPSEEQKGKYVLVDGARRVASAQKLEWTYIKATFSSAKNEKNAFLESMVANLNREDNTPYEVARSFHLLVTEYKFTNEKIAKACDRTAGYVSQHLAVMKADQQLQDALREEKVPLAIFRHFAKLNQEMDSDQYAAMVELALKGTSAQELGDRIDKYLEKKDKSSEKKKAKRGAAAHKKKAKAPKLQIPDYKSAAVSKNIKMVPKTKAVELMSDYRQKAIDASTARKRDYYMGVLEGMEMLTGLLAESD